MRKRRGRRKREVEAKKTFGKKKNIWKRRGREQMRKRRGVEKMKTRKREMKKTMISNRKRIGKCNLSFISSNA